MNLMGRLAKIAAFAVGGGGALLQIGGFVALAVAPMVGMVAGVANGSRESAVTVVVNDATFTAEVRAAFVSAKKLGIVTEGRGAIRAVDLFETRGGYRVVVDRATAKIGELTGSERREALQRVCASGNADLAMIGRLTATESNVNVWTAMFVGRAKTKTEWIEDLRICSTGKLMSFSGTIEIDVGAWNPKTASELEEMAGAEIGSKILDAIGAARSQSPAERGIVETSTRPEAVSSPARTAESGRSDSAPSEGKLLTVSQTQKYLAQLGYQVGPADGVLGRRTVDAIRAFQKVNGLMVTGRIDVPTSSKLSEQSAK